MTMAEKSQEIKVFSDDVPNQKSCDEAMPLSEKLLGGKNEEPMDDVVLSKAVIGVDKTRATWSGKLEFTMSALSLAVGMGNLWRFPYLCYRNGGGAFLIPYVFLSICLGLPLLFLEYAFGQYGRAGIIPIWAACPLFEGVGWAMFILSCCVSVYYIVIISWCVFYVVASMAPDVPWRYCGQGWNTPDCVTMSDMVIRQNCTSYNGTWFNNTCHITDIDTGSYLPNHTTSLVSASDEFFHHNMLGLSDGLHDMGAPRWPLVLCLLFCWLVVFLSLAKGIKTSGKVTYITALIPYIVLFSLLIRALTLEGSSSGIMYFITPQWHQLTSPSVWGDAAVQLFFSISLLWGGQLTLASYNDFNNNCFRDAIVVIVGDTLTSVFGGVVIFAFLGYMANVLQVPVENVATQGPGLAFVVYPEGVTTLPMSQFWAALFMLMLISVGLGTQIGIVQTIQTTLVDSFPAILGSGVRPVLLLITTCTLGFLLGLPCTTNGGMYLIQLLDTYSASYGVMIITLSFLIAIPWIYGLERFGKNLNEMMDFVPGLIWQLIWKIVLPCIVLSIFVFSLTNVSRVSYRGYTLPRAVDLIGWGIVAIEVLCIPAVALSKAYRLEGPFFERLKFLCKPSQSWGNKLLKKHKPSDLDESV